MFTTISTIHSPLLRAVTCALVVFGLAAPVVHAAPAASSKASASQKRLNKRAEVQAKLARAKAVQDALDAAQRERDQELARVLPLRGIGHHEQAADRLFAAAVTHNDPVLYIEAAEQFLAAADRRHRSAVTRGQESIAAARIVLTPAGDPSSDERPDPRARRVAEADVEGLLERCAAVQRRLHVRADELRGQRKGQQELIAGASMLAVGLTGVGVLAGGLAHRAARRTELAAIAGHEAEYDLSPIEALGRRGDAMIGVGAAVGVIGVVLGTTLMVIGARDLRGEAAPRRAHLRVAPTLGGLVLSGRF